MRWPVSLLVVICSRAANAAPEEIQVYLDEMRDPGTFGLDVHNNYVVSGDPIADYTGEQQSVHRYRVTPELAYGVTRYLELGLYLPLATLDRDVRFHVDGVKVRVKFIAPRTSDQHWFWGANFEIGGVDRELDINPFNAELKGILGFREGRWIAGFNLNLDFKVEGPASAPPSLELDTKLGYRVAEKVALGFESYNGAGETRSLVNFARAQQSTFAIVDASIGNWDLDLGIGVGYSTNPDEIIAKAIIGVPID